MLILTIMVLSVVLVIYLLNRISYVLLKRRIFNTRRWDLNICCGKTDGGGLNADIFRHSEEIRNFVLIRDIYNLPFANRQFEHVLCSHTVEHVDDPARFDTELRRVGETVQYILPPLWDFGAAFNFLEHKWIFLTCRKAHNRLPRYVRLPFSRVVHKHLEQRIIA